MAQIQPLPKHQRREPTPLALVWPWFQGVPWPGMETVVKWMVSRQKPMVWSIATPGTRLSSILVVNPPKQGLFHSKQGSFGFQAQIYCHNCTELLGSFHTASWIDVLEIWSQPSTLQINICIKPAPPNLNTAQRCCDAFQRPQFCSSVGGSDLTNVDRGRLPK